MNSINFLEEMGNFTFAAKYAKYDEKRGRREVWEETVNRLEKMHLKKFSHLPDSDKLEIKWAFDLVRSKRVAPSMRSLQFGGKAIEAHNARMFNCSVSHIASLRSFAESFYMLLAGCGMGFGLSEKFLRHLPDLVSSNDKTGCILTYTVQDNIEGWSDSVEALLMAYFRNTPFTGRKIVFDYSRIRPEGTPLKTGGGKAPGYKGLKAAHIKIKELLDYIIEHKEQPRLKTINAYDILMHCADAVLSGGIRRSACAVIFDINDSDMMNAKTFFEVQKAKRFVKDEDTGMYHGKVVVNKKTYDVEVFENDYTQIVKNKKISWYYIEPQRARSNNSTILFRDKVSLEQFENIVDLTQQFGEPGFVFADSSTPDILFNPCVTGDTLVSTTVGDIQIKDLVCRFKSGETFYALSYNIPTGAVEEKRITMADKTRENAEILEITTETGETLKLTPDHKVLVETEKMSGIINEWVVAGELTIGTTLLKVVNLDDLVRVKLKTISILKNEDVYDICVSDNHNFFANKLLIHNCFEVAFEPITPDGRCGVQVCNLTTTNGAKIKTETDMMDAVKAAAIIGTLQATYTHFPYLSNAAKELTEREALLGVSITGMMENPDIIFNPEIQTKAAILVKETNAIWASKLGINKAARTTLVKPEGTSSVILGTSSGIHAHHARKYIRRIQCNKMDPVYKFFKKNNPHACEQSVWSATKTDDVISFPIDINPTAMIKSDLTAIKHLELIKSTQANWVVPGTLDPTSKLVHNVSCTVLVAPDEWKLVVKYLYDNRQNFAAVSLLSTTGDKQYKQAPMEEVTTEEDQLRFDQLKASWKKTSYVQFTEDDDTTKLQQEFVCTGGACEIKQL